MQMHGYSDGRTRSGGTARSLERGDLQQHNTPPSYQRSVATIQGHDMEEKTLGGGCSTAVEHRPAEQNS